MKKQALIGLLAAAFASITTTALAFSGDDTDYFTIGRIEAAPNSSNGYRIYPAPGYALPTTQNCLNGNDFAELTKDVMQPDRDMIQRTVLAAFMSGRKVKLRLDGCGVQDRPAYRIVTLASDR